MTPVFCTLISRLNQVLFFIVLFFFFFLEGNFSVVTFGCCPSIPDVCVCVTLHTLLHLLSQLSSLFSATKDDDVSRLQTWTFSVLVLIDGSVVILVSQWDRLKNKKKNKKKIVIMEKCKLYIWNELDPSYDDNRLIHSRMNFLSLRESESTHSHQHSNRFWSASRKTAVNVSEWLCTWVSHVWMYFMYKYYFSLCWSLFSPFIWHIDNPQWIPHQTKSHNL